MINPKHVSSRLMALSTIALLVLSSISTTNAAKSGKKLEYDTSELVSICGKSYPPLKTKLEHRILTTLLGHSRKLTLATPTSPQHLSMCWVIHSDKKNNSNLKTAVQRYALGVLFFATSGPVTWADKSGWMTDANECGWYGVGCDSWGRVTFIDAPLNNMDGIVPGEIRLLTDLKSLNIHGNEIQGVIPFAIGELKRLERLNLHMNGFFGSLPTQIGKLTNLKELSLYGNYIQGTIPVEIGNLKRLETLDLFGNYFQGTIPSRLGDMKALREVYLNDLNLEGAISPEMCKKLKRNVKELWADCRGNRPEVECECCTVCCKDELDPKCARVVPKKTVKK